MQPLLTSLLLLTLALPAVAQQSHAVPGAVDAAGRKVLTFVNKDPPGLLFNEKVRKEYEDLRGMIRSGGK
ncbi:MAG: hypothetical protein FD187_2859 [bacterium]|nr:MAG: hypothetical protein FD142_2688 [bacterium]KAF0147353.1 MAG: hypothetical protein FD187_2859 [bacterium]KAF0165531.1 MAG: hypothetical protein FD158_2868 [bacterium]TXT17068.1 MAG: hypothetical protein FD132_2582 [bacterium]